MEELANILVNNGIGVGSFIALIIFMYKYLNKMDDTLEIISKTLVSIQENLNNLSTRVTEIENKVKVKEK